MKRSFQNNLQIIITRALPRGEYVKEYFINSGLEPIKIKLFPLVKIFPLTVDKKNIPEILNYQHMVFMSINAVNLFFNFLYSFYFKNWANLQNQLIKINFYTIGSSTAKFIQKFVPSIEPIFSQKRENSESLLKKMQNINNSKILLIKGEGGRDILQKELSKNHRNNKVKSLILYKRENILQEQELEQLLQIQTIIIISSMQELKSLCFNDKKNLFIKSNIKLIVCSIKTFNYAYLKGYKNIYISQKTTAESQVQLTKKIICEHFNYLKRVSKTYNG